ncbi:MAG: RagB/SusD family nutrient uptake outer membrane protein [Balneolaceae bacterium]
MKTMNKLSFILVIVTGLLFVGCSDVLQDVDPSTAISDEEALSSAEGVDLLRASIYSKMRESSAFTTRNLIGPGALADESSNRTGSSRYSDLSNATGTSGTAHLGNNAYYEDSYNVIQDANLLIGGIEDEVLDQSTEEQYRGEGYALRAYAYHNLVKAFGYEPGNYDLGPEGNWDAGVPLRTGPVFSIEDVDERERATVDAVYEQILSDLDNAETLLAGVSDNSYANEAFVYGLKARVNLYAGNWDDAAEAAQNAIDLSATLEDSEEGVATMFDEGAGNHPEALFKIVVDPDTEPIAGSNVNNGPAAYTAQQWVAQIPTQFVLDIYDEDDYRNGWFKPCPASGCDAANDSEVASLKWDGNKGNLADDLPLMRVSEMYLIQAEALAKEANSPAAGVNPLQELKDARNAGTIPAEALLSMEAFEDEILDERVRELNFEGHRFWDLKRLGRHIPTPTGDQKIRFDSYRLLAPIGNANLNSNPELVENPNY